MTAESHYLDFNFKARYYQLGTLNESTRHLWIVMHGHGHLAQYFIKQFEVLDDGKTCIIAPEGLSRYYLEGFYGRVGSTWMTKEDRLTDIRNYVQYLNSVYTDVMARLSGETPTTLLGFSQGAATVSRWALQDHVKFQRLILWAGLFPPDLDFEYGKRKLEGIKIYSIVGERDKYLNHEVIKEQQTLEKKLGVESEKIRFNGEHEINKEVLKNLV